MDHTTILKKGEGIFLWIYKNITNKITNDYQKLKDIFPVLNRYPLLKYGFIPMVIALFFLARYIIQLVIGELAAWASGFVGEASGYNISERAIFISIAAMFIISRLTIRLRSQKKDKNNGNAEKEKTEVAI